MWKRQLRWARLRRATFPGFYAPELLTSSLSFFIAAAFAGPEFDVSPLVPFLIVVTLWYGIEAALAKWAGWPLNVRSPLAWALRDLMLPWLWIQGWAGDSFEWRGNAMNVAEETLAEGGRG